MEHATGHAAYADPPWARGGALPQAVSAAAVERRVSGRAALWDAVLQAIADVDRLLLAGVLARPAGHGGAMPAAAPGAAMGDAVEDGLAALHADVRDRLDRLRATLSGQPDGDRMMLVLIIFVDERVMQQLPEDVRVRWPLLQIPWLGSSHGGEELYRILDRLLDDARTSGLLLEIFYFCLSNGFEGRYTGNREAIEGYRRRLRARIGIPEPGPGPDRAPATPEMPLPWQAHPGWYYLGTAVLMVGTVVLMTALSNCGV